eukprot:275618-Pleurochrysis_carterae.AAC.2
MELGKDMHFSVALDDTPQMQYQSGHLECRENFEGRSVETCFTQSTAVQDSSMCTGYTHAPTHTPQRPIDCKCAAISLMHLKLLISYI